MIIDHKLNAKRKVTYKDTFTMCTNGTHRRARQGLSLASHSSHAKPSVPTVKVVVGRDLPSVAADCHHLHVPVGVVMVVVLVSNHGCCSERGTYWV